MTPVWHYDGASAIRRDCTLEPVGDGFRLTGEGVPADIVRWADLTHGGTFNGAAIYGLKGRKGWRIGFEAAPPPVVAAHLPKGERYGRVIDKFGLGPTSAVFIALSAACIYITVRAPDFLAPLVPMSWEKQLGDAMVGDMGGRICKGPASDAALAAMTRRLAPKGAPVTVQIANIGMVNAVALPGGRIIIFRGLLQEAKSPDELAGVLGHEMGHVVHRDVMGALMRQMGLSVVLGGASGAGGQAGEYLNVLVSSTYSRDAEANADAYAMKAMDAANVSAVDTAGFFGRLAALEKKLDDKSRAAIGWVSSHPLSASREKAFRASVKPGRAYTPAVTPEQWRAIIDACRNDPDVKEGDSLLF